MHNLITTIAAQIFLYGATVLFLKISLLPIFNNLYAAFTEFNMKVAYTKQILSLKLLNKLNIFIHFLNG